MATILFIAWFAPVVLWLCATIAAIDLDRAEEHRFAGACWDATWDDDPTVIVRRASVRPVAPVRARAPSVGLWGDGVLVGCAA